MKSENRRKWVAALLLASLILPCRGAGVAPRPSAAGSEADWPAYRADAGRTGVSSQEVAFPLALKWSYEPSQPPAAAWPEPGKELNRTDFDYAFQPVAAAGRVYFASSADDTVRALDLETGRLVWRFSTGAPVRLAPAVAGGLVYAASDDGCVYCLDARTGTLKWRFQAGPESDRILGNGRIIARSPCRSGVCVIGNVVYTTAGMWPTEGVYVYALDAESGRKLWCNDSSGTLYIDLPHAVANGFSGVAPQGYLAASRDVLLVPTGRSVPAGFDRHTGRLLYYKPQKTHYRSAQYGGGVWCTAVGDLYFNPRNRFQNPSKATVGEAAPGSQDGMVVYALDSGEQAAQLRGKYRVLVNGDAVYAVGGGTLDAVDLPALLKHQRVRPADVRWSTPHPERAYCLIQVGHTVLTGNRDCIRAFDAATGRPVWKVALEGEAVRGLAVAGGRLLAATGWGRTLCFGAKEPTATGPPRTIREPVHSWQAATDRSAAAADIVRRAGKTEGYALVTGEPYSALAAALAAQSHLCVVSLVDRTEQVRADRERLLDAGLLGKRVAVFASPASPDSQLPAYFASLVVVSAAEGRISPTECARVLRPCGGTLVFLGFDAAARQAFVGQAGMAAPEFRFDGERVVRGSLPGAGEWRYPWADGGRSGVGGESRVRLPLELLWFGGPGPGRLMDRHLMGSPPLSVNGRVFIEGEQCIIAMDAYTGRELWSRTIPGIGRKYAQYYSSNFVADGRGLYAARHDRCYRLNQATGAVTTEYAMPGAVLKTVPPPVVPKYMNVQWPVTWQVLGPFPKGRPPLKSTRLATTPEQVTVKGLQYTVREMKAGPGGLLDFTRVFPGYGLKPPPAGEAPGAKPRRAKRFSFPDLGRICYAFARITAPTQGKVLVGAGADWGMQWYLDGRLVFDASRNDWNARRKGYFSRQPCSVTDGFFDVHLSVGEHVLAVLVTAGSRGWALASASMAGRAATLMPTVHGENPNVPDLADLTWGYLSVTDDLLLGTCNAPIAAGLPAEQQLLRRSEGAALFAIDKADETLRWVHRPAPGRIVSNIEIAWSDGRIFLIEGTSKADLVRARRRGQKIAVDLTLVALNLADGRELWRQEDVPVLPDRAMLPRLKSNVTHLFMGLPNWGHLVCSRGIVLYGANAAYDPSTGKKLWQTRTRPGKLPIVYGDRIITGTGACDLRTGKPRMTQDPLTGNPVPWRYLRSYGCGPTAGCQNLLFFRSGDDGLFDMLTGGTTNFGGVRSGCARTLLAANGLLIHPQGYSGCPCCYNYKTNLALVSSPHPRDVWYVFPRGADSGPVRRLALNFGAPGDRRGPDGTVWLGFPRPMLSTVCPAPVTLSMNSAELYYRRRRTRAIRNTESPWIYASGLRGHGRIDIGLFLRPGPVLATGGIAPTVDGNPGESCWAGVIPVPFQNTPFTTVGTVLDFRMFRDAGNVYFGFHRSSETVEGPARKPDPAGSEDDLDVFLMDRKKRCGIRFVIRADGKTSATFGTVGVSRKVDPAWKGDWRCVVHRMRRGWGAEAAIPIKMLKQSGIDLRRLAINAMFRGRTGRDTVFLTDPYYGDKFRCCSRFLPVLPPPPHPVPERRFTVRLHFAEAADAKPGRRVFDVKLQGNRVLHDFDPVQAAGGINRAVVKSFTGIKATDRITLELESASAPVPQALEPTLCGLDIVQEAP